MSQNQLTGIDCTELIRLDQPATGTVCHDPKTDKNVVMSNLAYQLPENLRNSDGKPAQH